MVECPKSPTGKHEPDKIFNRCQWCQKELGQEKSDKLKDLFAGRTLEGYVEAAKVRTLDTFKGVTFYFETSEDRQRAYELLVKHKFYFPYGPDLSLTGIINPDYMLELLASEGFDTSRILVERT
jgi:hypothetical protein